MNWTAGICLEDYSLGNSILFICSPYEKSVSKLDLKLVTLEPEDIYIRKNIHGIFSEMF